LTAVVQSYVRVTRETVNTSGKFWR
jgi:hypothetical protein